MKGHGEKFTRKMEAAIGALLSSPTIAEAAVAVGVGEVTLWRWLQRDDFQSRYRAARRQVVESAIARLQAATGEAVETLRRNLTSGKPGVEVRAAVAILQMSLKALELDDLDVRITALETAQDAGGEVVEKFQVRRKGQTFRRTTAP